MIEIVEISRNIPNGVTMPYVVWCSDGKKYAVKFPGNPEGMKALVNEYIASRLCEYLGLPILEYSLIKVRLENYTDNMAPEISKINGTAFGTMYDDSLLNVLNPGQIKKAVNCYDAIKILIFDILIGNHDRNKGNLMINSKTKKVIMIDHTHLFNLGVLWDQHQLKIKEQEKFSIENLNVFNYNNLRDSLTCDKKFYLELYEFIKKIKNIDRKCVEKILDDLPDDWEVKADEKEGLINFIVTRFKKVEEILDLLNLKGGDNSEI